MSKKTFVVVLVALFAVFTVFGVSSEAKVMDLFEKFKIDVLEGWQVDEDKENNTITFIAPDGEAGLTATSFDVGETPVEDVVEALVKELNGKNSGLAGNGFTFEFEAEGQACRAIVAKHENMIMFFTIIGENSDSYKMLQSFDLKN